MCVCARVSIINNVDCGISGTYRRCFTRFISWHALEFCHFNEMGLLPQALLLFWATIRLVQRVCVFTFLSQSNFKAVRLLI